MTRLRRVLVSAAGIALCAPVISLARDFAGTGLPEQTLSTLELDQGFGRRGEVRSALSGGIRFVSFDRVAIQWNGNIVVGGSATAPGSRSLRPCVARFFPDGRLDRTFAGGIVALPVRGWIGGILVDIDGRVVACGKFRGVAGTGRADATYAAVRLRADGRLDREFSGDGLAEADTSNIDHVVAARTDPRDGAVLALVSIVAADEPNGTGVIRFAVDGTFDSTYGGDGLAEATGNASSMAVDGKGGVIVGGSKVVRLTPDGVRDMMFGGVGTVKGPHGGDLSGTVAIDDHNRIVIAGSGDRGGEAIFRCFPSGDLDTSFDGDGRSPVPLAVPHNSLDSRFQLLATTSVATEAGYVNRYVAVSRLQFSDFVPGDSVATPAGTGYIVQTIDPSNLGTLAAFVHSDPRPVERMSPEMNDLAVTQDGLTAIVVGAETQGPRGRRRTTPLLFRVDLTPRDAVALPEFTLAWAAQPTLTAFGPNASGVAGISAGRDAIPLLVTNAGATNPTHANVRIWLSDNGSLDPSDIVLTYADAGIVAAGATAAARSGSIAYFFNDPGFTGLTGKRLIAQVNPDGLQPESDTTNNLVVSDPLP